MQSTKQRDRIYTIGGLLLEHAPNAQAQAVVTRILNDSTTTEVSIAGQLYDGLAYGNWPWGTDPF